MGWWVESLTRCHVVKKERNVYDTGDEYYERVGRSTLWKDK